MSARYSAFALAPVSEATTVAAFRGCAPASTSLRTASRPWSRERRASAPRDGADHQHDLALRGLVRVAGGQLGGAAAHDLLVGLRQLAADGHLALRVELGQQRERAREPAGGLERHERAVGMRQHLAQLALLAREEALEVPPVGRQPRGHQRGDRRRRPRQHLHRQPGGDAAAHQHVAGVRHERHPGVGDERHHGALAHPCDQLRGTRLLVVLVVETSFALTP